MAIKIKHNGNWITIPTGENVIKVTYAELKALVDAGELKQAVEYEITDFVSTCIDATDSRFASAAIPYHVVVYAQTTKKLGMYAKAIPASEDASYAFKDCALDKWILKYDINGNYDWVGVGASVLKIDGNAVTNDAAKTLYYWMGKKTYYLYKDASGAYYYTESNAPVAGTAALSSPDINTSTEEGDISGTTLTVVSSGVNATRNVANNVKYYDSTGTEITLYGWDGTDGETYYTKVESGNSVPVWTKTGAEITGVATTFTEDTETTLPTGFTGTIYYMKDEFGNEAPYDFKNIKFKPTDNTYFGTKAGILCYDPKRNVTYTSGSTEVTLVAVSGQLFLGTSKMGFFDATNKKIQTATFTFTNEWTISEVAADYSYIKANNKKWERVADMDFDFSAYSASTSYYAWVDDDANYVYTTVEQPVATTGKAFNTITGAVLVDGEEVTQTAVMSIPMFTFDTSVSEDNSLAGNVKNTVIKGNSDKSFPFIIAVGGEVKNVSFAKDSNNITLVTTNASRLKFKGNQYLYIIGVSGYATDVAENYTFVNEFGGDSTETKVFYPTLNLATENLVGSADNGNTITKNPFKALQSFYQRNEPLNANEGDIWFSVED